ncbi:dihydroorotate dehydrogenase electron transfer subunit [Pseudogracilibacillus auburnensis]|uniref:Dihydroorotate dehydrogenase electron transfer subunit n=1 Tax=Pseudogracilibacillus auburnensis TaxID=1494959 RepID=A0A2V3VSN8_9BACI|nr:dihydroorotate dehydrogenase electron transfer subunit [Pseudogracilibacillus auburnensis]MBO1003845.1 dihydroorotate dehydrogenase electron transfer subunit [Pseudogracilibacillus auburnensis]PXW84766.1 dihydroorotate dehydrogenase electron transfer subunit [Pseudogracilibacillus auburnensis]
MQVNKLEVLSNVKVSERYWHMIVDSQELTNQIEPGQFFNIKCADDSFPFLRRPFSIYRINKEDGTIEFLYLVKGLGTVKLTEVKAGETVDVFGPLGVGFSLAKEWDTILLLARGVGIATLAALAQEAAKQNIKCVAILSARSNNDLLATETLQGFGAEVYKVTEEDGTSDVDNVEIIMEQIFKEHDVKAGFTCGSKRLSRLMQKVTQEKNIPAQIALEEHMGCAMGVCYACVCDVQHGDKIESVRVCKEGPVFDLDKVVLA